MHDFLEKLGIRPINPGVFCGQWRGNGPVRERLSPIDGQVIARVREAAAEDYEAAVTRAQEAFLKWRTIPAPVRGETIRRFGNALREAKPDLAKLVTLETGKILAEGAGEVQEMIDICDFAVGLSRQLYGLTIQSERPQHRLMEQWHPLGVVGVISAFNFPVAVWAWNSALAAVCGDAVCWKPSNKTPLCAIAATRIAEQVCRETGVDPAIFSLVIGDVATTGAPMAADQRIPLISATGSSAMGREVAQTVGRRLGRTILELGGNNAVIVTPSANLDLATRAIFFGAVGTAGQRCTTTSANLDLATRAIFFGAVGTAGQRCTTTRRVIVHESIEQTLRERLIAAYRSLKIGNPLDPSILMGPLIDRQAVQTMTTARNDCRIVQEETFAPLLYLIPYARFDEALTMHNAVPQGLSSGIFTNDFRQAEEFLSVCGSDCGIANVNAGTSGAEIGGAFGGEKETGGGRESGSDAWKSYMRRQTNTVNYSPELPLAQGIVFG